MKLYIIMVKCRDCEGKFYGEPEIFKIFINLADAKTFLIEHENSWNLFWMIEKWAE